MRSRRHPRIAGRGGGDGVAGELTRPPGDRVRGVLIGAIPHCAGHPRAESRIAEQRFQGKPETAGPRRRWKPCLTRSRHLIDQLAAVTHELGALDKGDHKERAARMIQPSRTKRVRAAERGSGLAHNRLLIDGSFDDDVPMRRSGTSHRIAPAR